jgi:hypothetical protein
MYAPCGLILVLSHHLVLGDPLYHHGVRQVLGLLPSLIDNYPHTDKAGVLRHQAGASGQRGTAGVPGRRKIKCRLPGDSVETTCREHTYESGGDEMECTKCGLTILTMPQGGQ